MSARSDKTDLFLRYLSSTSGWEWTINEDGQLLRKRRLDGTWEDFGLIEFATGGRVYWYPSASIRYVDVPEELSLYEVRR